MKCTDDATFVAETGEGAPESATDGASDAQGGDATDAAE
jgi:hypothetical protein